nr:class C beta-lactamase [Ramlibacter cellulosilyticus]
MATLLPAAGHAAGARGDVAAIVDAAFQPLLARHGIPGLAVGVSVNGRQHVACYGLASKEDAQPVSTRTLFEIGSLSKTFTATLGAQALSTGKLSLHHPPSRYLPALRGSALDAATLLHLATYTAGGLPLQFPEAVTDETMLAYFRAWKPDAAPGRVRRYSNPSIGLFGLVAAKALGRDFRELLEGDLFPQLGLRDTYLRVPASAIPDYAWGYGKDGQRLRVNPGVLDAQAYGVKSTIADMLRFVEANLRPELLAPRLRQAVEATHVPHFRVGPLVQGLGWEQYPDLVPLARLLAGNAPAMALEPQPAVAIATAEPTGRAFYNKTGSTNGFAAYAAFVPARRAGIVMLANRNFPIEARVRAAHAVLERVAGRKG